MPGFTWQWVVAENTNNALQKYSSPVTFSDVCTITKKILLYFICVFDGRPTKRVHNGAMKGLIVCFFLQMKLLFLHIWLTLFTFQS